MILLKLYKHRSYENTVGTNIIVNNHSKSIIVDNCNSPFISSPKAFISVWYGTAFKGIKPVVLK